MKLSTAYLALIFSSSKVLSRKRRTRMDDRCLAKIKEGSFDGEAEEEYYDYNSNSKKRQNKSSSRFRTKFRPSFSKKECKSDDCYADNYDSIGDYDGYVYNKYGAAEGQDEDEYQVEEHEYETDTILVPGDNHLVIILDATGSMKEFGNKAIEGYNDFLQQAKDGAPDMKLTLIKFAQYMKISNYDRVADAPELTEDTYQRRGKTLLYDTLGCTLDALSGESGTMVQVFTDGLDTLSTIYDNSQVTETIGQLTQSQGWEISIAGNEAVSKMARRMGFTNVIQFRQNGPSMRRAFKKSGNAMFNNVQNGRRVRPSGKKNMGASRGTLKFRG